MALAVAERVDYSPRRRPDVDGLRMTFLFEINFSSIGILAGPEVLGLLDAVRMLITIVSVGREVLQNAESARRDVRATVPGVGFRVKRLLLIH